MYAGTGCVPQVKLQSIKLMMALRAGVFGEPMTWRATKKEQAKVTSIHIG